MISDIFISSVVSEVVEDVVQDKEDEAFPPTSSAYALSLFISSSLYLHDDAVPYWIQIVPYSISTEACVQHSDIRGFLHPSVISSGFYCQSFHMT